MAVTRKSIVADLRRIADLAEESGDRATAVKALRYAWDIVCHAPANPKPPSLDTIIEVCESVGPLVARFAPEDAARVPATVADLRRCRTQLIAAERESCTLH
ncbi:hypothetical protein HFN78_24740 [Rhizobium laguerreae]|nr:hypothetical protein [Rhizobium laguerreae]MBY3521885.1 hypothetical protein [Rhizobium laguerreae]